MPSRLGLLNTPTASLQRGKTPPTNECPRYDTKQCDGEVQLMLELLGMWSTPSLPSLPGPLWLGVVAPDRLLSMGRIKLNCILMLKWMARNETVLIFKLHSYAKLNYLKCNGFWHRNCSNTKLNCLNYNRLTELKSLRGCPRGVMFKAMDCGIIVREFVLQSCYYVHFQANTIGKGMNPLILPAMG